jgi:hypothetical protein
MQDIDHLKDLQRCQQSILDIYNQVSPVWFGHLCNLQIVSLVQFINKPTTFARNCSH